MGTYSNYSIKSDRSVSINRILNTIKSIKEKRNRYSLVESSESSYVHVLLFGSRKKTVDKISTLNVETISLIADSFINSYYSCFNNEILVINNSDYNTYKSSIKNIIDYITYISNDSYDSNNSNISNNHIKEIESKNVIEVLSSNLEAENYSLKYSISKNNACIKNYNNFNSDLLLFNNEYLTYNIVSLNFDFKAIISPVCRNHYNESAINNNSNELNKFINSTNFQNHIYNNHENTINSNKNNNINHIQSDDCIISINDNLDLNDSNNTISFQNIYTSDYVSIFSNMRKILLNDDLDFEDKNSFSFIQINNKSSVNGRSIEFRNVELSNLFKNYSHINDVFSDNGYKSNSNNEENLSSTFNSSFKKLKKKFVENKIIKKNKKISATDPSREIKRSIKKYPRTYKENLNLENSKNLNSIKEINISKLDNNKENSLENNIENNNTKSNIHTNTVSNIDSNIDSSIDSKTLSSISENISDNLNNNLNNSLNDNINDILNNNLNNDLNNKKVAEILEDSLFIDVAEYENKINAKVEQNDTNNLEDFEEDEVYPVNEHSPKVIINDNLDSNKKLSRKYINILNDEVEFDEDNKNDEDQISSIQDNIDEIIEEHVTLLESGIVANDIETSDRATEIYNFMMNIKPLVSKLNRDYQYLYDSEYDDIFNELYIIINNYFDKMVEKYSVNSISELDTLQKKEFIKDVCYRLKNNVYKNKFTELVRHDGCYDDNIIIENIYDDNSGEKLSEDVAVFNPNDIDTFSKFISGINKYNESVNGYIQYSKFKKPEDKHFEEILHSRLNIILNLLPIKTQSAIKLHIGFNGRKFEQYEIASILKTSRENISKKITAGYNKLQKIFAEKNITYEMLVSENHNVDDELKLIVSSLLARNNRDYYLQKKHKASNEDVDYSIFDEEVPFEDNLSQNNSLFQHYNKNKPKLLKEEGEKEHYEKDHTKHDHKNNSHTDS